MLVPIMLATAAAAVFFLLRRRRAYASARLMKSVVLGLLIVNGLIVAAAGVLAVTETPVFAENQAAPTRDAAARPEHGGWVNLSAAIAISFATVAAAIAVAVTGSAAIGGMSRNPEIFGRSLVFVGLAEGIAIYGLIIAFMILTG